MERVDIQEAYVWQERIEEFKKSGFSQRKWVSVKSDDTLRHVVSSKTRNMCPDSLKTLETDDTLQRIVSSKIWISRLCGAETPKTDDTLRHIVSSETRNVCSDNLKTTQNDDTMRHVVSSKNWISRPCGPQIAKTDDTLRHVVSSKTGFRTRAALKSPEVMILCDT